MEKTYGMEMDTSVSGLLATSSMLQLFPFGQQLRTSGGQSSPLGLVRRYLSTPTLEFSGKAF